MNGTIEKAIIFSTRITKNEFCGFSGNGNQQKTVRIEGHEYEYRIINAGINKVIILLNGFPLNTYLGFGQLEGFSVRDDADKKISLFLQLVNELASQENFQANENLIFAIHWGGQGVEESKKKTENLQKLARKHSQNVDFTITFWTTAVSPDSDIEPILREANPGITDEDFEKWFKIFKERNIPLTTKFSLIKHTIMTFFLDLDIDWQGINEASKKDIEIAKSYLGEVLNRESDNYYCQKLVNLWFYLTGDRNKGLKIDDNKITTSLNDDQRPYKKSILDIIREKPNDEHSKVLDSLYEHVGLNSNGRDARIIQYLQNLDSMNKGKKDINKFLSVNFHEWYLKLGDLLEELKYYLE